MTEWTVEDVCSWLENNFSFGYHYKQVFADAAITGSELQAFNDDRLLNELAITNSLHRRRILRDIEDSERCEQDLEKLNSRFSYSFSFDLTSFKQKIFTLQNLDIGNLKKK